MLQSLVRGIRENDHGSISKAITIIENGQNQATSLLADIYSKTSQSYALALLDHLVQARVPLPIHL